ncbi:hypothetical protein [Novosphingobium sp. Fuku2-ISO-50]|nr:hypothetical protein [Novosphingobium sp. Fuku2-ISO-50]
MNGPQFVWEVPRGTFRDMGGAFMVAPPAICVVLRDDGIALSGEAP